MTPRTISTSPTFNSTLREQRHAPPQPGPFGPPSGCSCCAPLINGVNERYAAAETM